MEKAGKRTYNTFHKVRLALFIRSYAAYCIQNHIKIKYEIDSKLKRSQLVEHFSRKRAIPEISKLSKVLNLDYLLLWQFIVFDRIRRLNSRVNSQDKIKAYLGIENEIVILKIKRQEKENIIHEDYERALLSPAIERAAGNSLKSVNNDLVFEEQLKELQKQYQRWYYKIAHKYKLPTPGIVPFILRLIT